MRVTVCELPDERSAFEAQWVQLAAHAHAASSQLVLLPDMPFAGWFAGLRRFDHKVWAAAIQAHDQWEHRLPELGLAFVLSSRPVDFGNERYDEGFVWDAEDGKRSVHTKARFNSTNGAWETSWYRNTWPDFAPLELQGVHFGFLMDTEIDAEDEALRYAAEHIDVLAMPRGAPVTAFDAWLSRARTLAEITHAYVLSSNRAGTFGGRGCIIAPTGEVLGVTSASQPFLTLKLALASEEAAAVVRPAFETIDSIDPWETGVPPD